MLLPWPRVLGSGEQREPDVLDGEQDEQHWVLLGQADSYGAHRATTSPAMTDHLREYESAMAPVGISKKTVPRVHTPNSKKYWENEKP